MCEKRNLEAESEVFVDLLLGSSEAVNDPTWGPHMRVPARGSADV